MVGVAAAGCWRRRARATKRTRRVATAAMDAPPIILSPLLLLLFWPAPFAPAAETPPSSRDMTAFSSQRASWAARVGEPRPRGAVLDEGVQPRAALRAAREEALNLRGMRYDGGSHQ